MRNASEWTLAEIRAQVAALSAEAKATAEVAEVHLSDDQILGRLFRLTAAEVVSVPAYTEVYDTTDAEGRFTSREARLIASRYLRHYTRG
jgi:hypothetical protein